MTDLTIADINATINHEPRIPDLRLAESLGFDRPRKMRELVERHRDALERFGSIPPHRGAKFGRGRPEEGYWLNRRQALYICTKAETERATEATIEMVEVFDAYLRGQLAPKPLSLGELSAGQRGQIRRRAQVILAPLFGGYEKAVEAALLARIAEILATGRLPDIHRLEVDIPELAAFAPAPAARPRGFPNYEDLRAAAGTPDASGHASMGALYIDDEVLMFNAVQAQSDGNRIRIDALVVGRWDHRKAAAEAARAALTATPPGDAFDAPAETEPEPAEGT